MHSLPTISFPLRLVYLANIFTKGTYKVHLFFSGSYKTYLDISPLPKLLPLYCKQINRVKNEVIGHSSNLIGCNYVSDYKAAFTPMQLVFLELGTHFHLNFRFLDETNNDFVPKTLQLQLLNKDYEYIP